MPYSGFKDGDVSLSEGRAEDLPEEARPEISRVVTYGLLSLRPTSKNRAVWGGLCHAEG